MLPPLFRTEWLARHEFLHFTSLSTCSCMLPAKLFSPNSDRRSDSLNGSIHEDDLATELRPEPIQTRQIVCNFTLVSNFPAYILFRQTPAMSPSHLSTPFNGQVIPSNLLETIGRKVTEIEGPMYWYHPQLAAGMKIVKLT